MHICIYAHVIGRFATAEVIVIHAGQVVVYQRHRMDHLCRQRCRHRLRLTPPVYVCIYLSVFVLFLW